VRNSGKSALFNRLCDHDISIVSSKPGTTGDPVTKGIEMGPLGPVALVDTAGFDDDEDEVGNLRTEKTHGVLALADAVVLVSRRDTPPSEEERRFAARMAPGKKPFLVVLTFGDRPADGEKLAWAAPFTPLTVANPSGEGVAILRQRLEGLAAHLEPERDPLEGLVSPSTPPPPSGASSSPRWRCSGTSWTGTAPPWWCKYPNSPGPTGR
jgi:small GTP-binding protein